MCPILLKLDSRIKIPLPFAKSLNKEKKSEKYTTNYLQLS